MSQPRVTVVVVPRESFNMFPEVIERAYRLTKTPFKMLIMEGKAPEAMRERFREFERTLPDCKVVWSNRWQFPHELVNQAIPMIETEYVVFIDNDVEIMEGCVEALVEAADEEKVNCVHPIYLTTTLKTNEHKIHVAEGKLVKQKRNGSYFLDSIMPYSGKKLEDYPDKRRKPSDFFEWHAVLFRTSLLHKIGPLDDLTIAEHVDYSLRLTAAGEKILLEPKAVGAYDYERIFELRGEDRDYMLYRWNVKRAADSLEKFRAKWNLHPDSTVRRLYWVKEHSGRVRQTFLMPRLINRLRRTVGMPNMPFVNEPRPVVQGIDKN
ncbi:MAG: hypothetical protein COV75_04035 [Candidatus Omnitrophica bacterium CG11_big_fil_rev_8_21_14_0_20_63_9]|nr:MAG: hypothetical protein COV75_04035 [Candidatus Omnitrophica bacterium CG11_big_fil_rev_8_21_14_0_20_63_9]